MSGGTGMLQQWPVCLIENTGRSVKIAALILGCLLGIVGCRNAEEASPGLVAGSPESDSFAIVLQEGAFLLLGRGSTSGKASPTILETYDSPFVDFILEPFDATLYEGTRFESTHGNSYEVVSVRGEAQVYLVVDPECPSVADSGLLRTSLRILLGVELDDNDPVEAAKAAVEHDTAMPVLALYFQREYGEGVARGVTILGSSDRVVMDMNAPEQLLYTDSDVALVQDLVDALSAQIGVCTRSGVGLGDSCSLILGDQEVELTVSYAESRLTQANGLTGIWFSAPESEQHWIVSEETHLLDGTGGIKAARVRVYRGVSWGHAEDLAVRVTEFLVAEGHPRGVRTELYAYNPEWRGLGWPPLPLPSQWTPVTAHQTLSASSFTANLDVHRPSPDGYRLLCIIEKGSDSTKWEYFDAHAVPKLVITVIENRLEDGSLERVWKGSEEEPVAVQVWDDDALTAPPDRAWYAAGDETSFLYTRASGFRLSKAGMQPISDGAALAAIDASSYSRLESSGGTGVEEVELPRSLVEAYRALWQAAAHRDAERDSRYEVSLRGTTYVIGYAEGDDFSLEIGFIGRLNRDLEGSLVAYFMFSPNERKVFLWLPFSPFGYVVTGSTEVPANADHTVQERLLWGRMYLSNSVRGELDIAATYRDWQKRLARAREMREKLKDIGAG